MSYSIIVSRYNENIDWTKNFENVIIYNKGDKLLGYDNVVTLENVGREGHTYYKYIYDNYDNLSEYTVFLQGNPFDHSPNLIKNIKKCLNDKALNFQFCFLSERIISCNLDGCIHYKDLPIKKIYKNLFGEDKDNMPFIFGAGAQFIVSKTSILKRPREFYLKIIQMLEYSSNPIEGHVIERFHKIIFS